MRIRLGCVILLVSLLLIGAEEQCHANKHLAGEETVGTNPVRKKRKMVPFLRKDGLYEYVWEGTKKRCFTGQFEDAYLFYDGLAKVKLNGRFGFINKGGDLVIPCSFNYASQFHDGFCRVSTHDWGVENAGLIDRKGRLIIDTAHYYVGYGSDGIVSIFDEDSVHFADTTGKLINLSYSYTLFGEFSVGFHEGLCAYPEQKEGDEWYQYGFKDVNGEIVIPAKYALWGGAGLIQFPHFSDGLAVFTSGTFDDVYEGKARYGYMDRTGKTVIPAQFEGASPFSEGLAAVRVGDSVRFIDRSGKFAFPLVLGGYDEGGVGFYYHGFEDGLCIVNLNGPTYDLPAKEGRAPDSPKEAVINSKGEILVVSGEGDAISQCSAHFVVDGWDENRMLNRRTGETMSTEGLVMICGDGDFIRAELTREGPEVYIDRKGMIYKEDQ